MSTGKLREDLERLRREIDRMPADQSASRQNLDALIADIESRISEETDRDLYDRLTESVREAIAEFETEHPRATAILNDIMVSLSNMGI